MKPPFRPGVVRRELFNSFDAVNLRDGSPSEILAKIVCVVHSANFNDPQHFIKRDYYTMRRSA